jgi:hypothetical protein
LPLLLLLQAFLYMQGTCSRFPRSTTDRTSSRVDILLLCMLQKLCQQLPLLLLLLFLLRHVICLLQLLQMCRQGAKLQLKHACICLLLLLLLLLFERCNCQHVCRLWLLAGPLHAAGPAGGTRPALYSCCCWPRCCCCYCRAAGRTCSAHIQRGRPCCLNRHSWLHSILLLLLLLLILVLAVLLLWVGL